MGAEEDAQAAAVQGDLAKMKRESARSQLFVAGENVAGLFDDVVDVGKMANMQGPVRKTSPNTSS